MHKHYGFIISKRSVSLGARNFKKEYKDLLSNFEKIYIHSEEDDGAKVFVETICQILPIDKCYIINSKELGSKDPSELHIKGEFDFEELLKTSIPATEIIKKQIIKSISAKELMSKKIEPLKLIVENMLYQGFTVLGGAPKIGKSWLCLDLGLSVSTGSNFLGYKTNKGDCLYLALEDSEGRTQNRLSKILKDNPAPDGFHLAYRCSTLDDGLIEELDDYLKHNSKIQLIIIDTLQKVRGNPNRTSTMYGNDYKEIGILKEFADKHSICILAIHHLRKMNDTDVFNKISGSTGITGAADTMIVLDKNGKQNNSVFFSITGRDVESDEKLLMFNTTTYRWEVIEDNINFNDIMEELNYQNNPIVITIKRLLEENPEGIKITASNLLKKIYEITGVFPKQDKANSLSREINDNIQFQLLKYDGIYYEKPNENGGKSGRLLHFSKPKKQ